MHVERASSHRSLQNIPCQTETSIAETRKEKKEQSEGVRERMTVEKGKKKSLEQVPELSSAPVWKWWILAKRTFHSVSICLNCSLAITSCYYLIIVVNEPQKKIIGYQGVDHYVWDKVWDNYRRKSGVHVHVLSPSKNKYIAEKDVLCSYSHCSVVF